MARIRGRLRSTLSGTDLLVGDHVRKAERELQAARRACIESMEVLTREASGTLDRERVGRKRAEVRRTKNTIRDIDRSLGALSDIRMIAPYGGDRDLDADLVEMPARKRAQPSSTGAQE